jgi:hypothetical protein
MRWIQKRGTGLIFCVSEKREVLFNFSISQKKELGTQLLILNNPRHFAAAPGAHASEH